MDEKTFNTETLDDHELTETKSISSIIIKWQFEVPFQVFIAASSFVSYVNKLHLKKSATVEYFYFSCI